MGGVAEPTPASIHVRVRAIVSIGHSRRDARDRAFGLAASAVFHVLVGVVLALWQDVPPATHEPAAIQVEFVQANAPSKGVANRPLREPAFVPPTEEGAFAAPLKLDPSLRLNTSRTESFDKSAPADSGTAPRADPLQNYGVVVGDMVSRHIRYPEVARAHHEEGIVKISLEVARDGSLLDVHAEVIGRPEFAAAAIAAVHAAAPYPRFPAAMNRATAEINFAIVIQDPDIPHPPAKR